MQIIEEKQYLSLLLPQYVKIQTYLTDSFEQCYEIFNRIDTVLKASDSRKELLFNKIQKIYESYPPNEPNNLFYKSAKALRKLIDMNHNILFAVKKYAKEESSGLPDTKLLNSEPRKVIIDEYSNMKYIRKLGRYNGWCLYTYYENIPEDSKNQRIW